MTLQLRFFGAPAFWDDHEGGEEVDETIFVQLWRWQLERFRADICTLVDAHFAPNWLYVGFDTRNYLGVFTELQITVRGKRHYFSQFQALLRHYLATGEIPT
jgi:hypothetical protein